MRWRPSRPTLDYVVKPIDPLRLAKVIAKLQAANESRNAAAQLQAPRAFTVARDAAAAGALEWLHVASGQQVRTTHVDDVMYFESDTKYTWGVATA